MKSGVISPTCASCSAVHPHGIVAPGHSTQCLCVCTIMQTIQIQLDVTTTLHFSKLSIITFLKMDGRSNARLFGLVEM